MPVRDLSVVPAPIPPCRGLHLVPANSARTAASETHASNLLYRASTIAAALYFIATSF
jgi:hypothetical protein